jgi:hypothetical protein
MPTPSSPAGLALAPAQQAAAIARLVAQCNGGAGEVAIALWEPLSKNLASLIGQQGFQALFDRSLHLAGVAFPWLSMPTAFPDTASRLDNLKALLGREEGQVATDASVMLLTTFAEVLAGLIGPPLTTNILRAAWGIAFDEAVQDTSK